MKTPFQRFLRFIPGLMLLAAFSSDICAAPLGTEFTYQGQLNEGAVPANGSYDFRFSLHDAATDGNQIGGSLTNSASFVSSGTFTVLLDFGSVFDGNARWLQLGVRTNGAGEFTTLLPRQPLKPAPYSLHAANAAEAATAATATTATTATTAITANSVAAGSVGTAGLANSSVTASKLASDPASLAKVSGGAMSVSGSAIWLAQNEYLADNNIFLRSDTLHGLGWYGTGKLFAGYNVNGPVLYGVANGALGTSGGGETVALYWTGAGNVGIGGMPNDSRLDVQGNIRLNRNDLHLREGTDRFHGLGWYGATKLFAGFNVDGPVLYGFNGGGLGTTAGSTNLALVWNNSGRVGIGKTAPISELDVNGRVTAGSFRGTPGSILTVGTTDGQPFELVVNNDRGMRLEQGSYTSINVVGGWRSNFVASGIAGATVAGGGAGNFGPSGDTYINRVEADFGTVSGGAGNGIWGTNSSAATIAGGRLNRIDGAYLSTIGGGYDNWIATGAHLSTIGGGESHFIQAGMLYATIPGGYRNRVAGDYSFAAGNRAKANHAGTFVWADSTAADFTSTAANQFLIRANGGVGIGTATPDSNLHVKNLASNGGSLRIGANSSSLADKIIRFGDGDFVTIGETAQEDDVMRINGKRVGVSRFATANRFEVEGDASKTSAGSWLANSDARIKQDIQPIQDALQTLARVRPVSFQYTEDYRNQHESLTQRRYLNVVAQEFAEVFPEHVASSGEKLADGSEILQVDTYPLTIYSVAAIQELNQKLTVELNRRDVENKALKERVERLEQLLTLQTGGAR
jgi:hypothetical protein